MKKEGGGGVSGINRWAFNLSTFLHIFTVLKKLLLTWTEISPGFECFGKSKYYSGRRVRICSLTTK